MEYWPLPLSIIKDEEASFSPRQEFGGKRISELDSENRPSFKDIAIHIVEGSSIPERFYDDVIGWLEKGFDGLSDWQGWLLKSKPASTEIVDAPIEIKSVPKVVESSTKSTK